MKALKIIFGLLVVLVILVAGGAWFLMDDIDRLVKEKIEEVGSQTTGTEVTLDSVGFDLRAGRGSLSGLNIGNPPGFTSENAFTLDDIAVDIDTSSLLKDVIVIDEITVNGAQLVMEQAGAATNLQALYKNVRAATSEAPPEEPAGEPVRLMLKQFNFTGGQARLITTAYEEQTVSLPDIHLQNIGDTKTGLTPAELAARLMQTVLKQVQDGITGQLGEKAKEKIKEKLGKELQDKLGEEDADKLKGLKSLFDKE